jgi:hypothetical protein
VEALLEQHIDRFWTPLYHPQVFGPHAMTSAFLLQGLCASKHLFARKFAPDFSLRPQPRRCVPSCAAIARCQPGSRCGSMRITRCHGVWRRPLAQAPSPAPQAAV